MNFYRTLVSGTLECTLRSDHLLNRSTIAALCNRVLVEHPQIPSGERIGIFHPLGEVRFSSSLLVSESLFGFKKDRVLGIGVNDGYAQYLELLLHSSCTTGPEPVKACSLLAGLGDVAWIDGYCNAMSLCRFQERPVER